MIICELEGNIPVSGQPPKKVAAKYFTDVEANGIWIKKYLTSSNYKWKNISKVVSSETSKYKITRYFNYLPQSVLNAAEKHTTEYVASNVTANAGLTADHVLAKWIVFKCNIDVGGKHEY